MPNLHLQIHPIFIPTTSRVIIWDFRPVVVPGGRDYAAASMRISDLWNRCALSIILAAYLSAYGALRLSTPLSVR
jgi:hypothetical protein